MAILEMRAIVGNAENTMVKIYRLFFCLKLGLFSRPAQRASACGRAVRFHWAARNLAQCSRGHLAREAFIIETSPKDEYDIE